MDVKKEWEKKVKEAPNRFKIGVTGQLPERPQPKPRRSGEILSEIVVAVGEKILEKLR